MKKIVLLIILLPTLCFGQAIRSFKKLNNQVIVVLNKGELHLSPLSDNSMRVQYALDFKNTLPELVLTSTVHTPKFQVTESKSALEISTSKITVIVDKQNGNLSYRDHDGVVFLREKPGSRIFKQSIVQGQSCYIAGQSFDSPKDEFLYGTGQFQDGYLNIRGLSRRLTQVNTQISIPVIVSNKGYGLLWHNYGLTDFNPIDESIELKPIEFKGGTAAVDVTTAEGTKKETRQDALFSGILQVKEEGRYALLLDMGQKMSGKWQLTIDGKDVINFKNYWLPPTTSTFVELNVGKHEVVANGVKNDNPILYYRKVTDETGFRSPVADKIDYVVFAGNADEVISSYRNLTGKAPLMPIWSLGYIHCRERFNTQDEVLENAKEFRNRELPIDVIVQDWQYWGKYGWNAMRFDEEKYPNPAQMVNDLHALNLRLMVSVWSKMDKKSELGKEFESHGYYIPGTDWVDFFNPAAANFYWKNFSERLLMPYKIDAWWQDATEPENDDLVGRKINNGTMPGEQMRNVYPLYVTKTVYEGSRNDVPDKRVCILTRSGFPGQQRYASSVWSGDVGNDWETLRRQITAGLNLSVTGMPWWTFDAGGFFRPGEEQYNDADYHERFLRWFQVATFCPLQRVHGYQTNTEFWRFGEKVESEALKYLNLRYRLLPYIYSQAADITFNNGTLMRPLVMDFPSDKNALKQNYEYMFGPAFLVAPVLSKGVENQDVYLPATQSGWFDFWTGKHFNGGKTANVEVSLSTIPLFIKAGSILPMGKAMQYTTEERPDTLEIRVYTGSGGRFRLYEDEGINYNYEKGKYAVIPFEWDEQKQTLTIGKREGSFDGMLKKRFFNVVWVNDSNGTGINASKNFTQVEYLGEKVEIKKH